MSSTMADGRGGRSGDCDRGFRDCRGSNPRIPPAVYSVSARNPEGRTEGAMATAAGGGNNTEGTIGGFKVVASRVYQLERQLLDYEVTYSWESKWFIAH